MLRKQATNVFKKDKKVGMTEKAKQVVQSADIYGCPVQLQLKKSDVHQTIYGGCFTLFTVALSAFFFQQRVLEMLYRTSPVTLSSTLFSEEPPEYVLSPEKFFFAFAIQDFNSYVEYIDTSIFEVDFQLCNKRTVFVNQTKQYEDQYGCVSMPWEPCDLKKHFKIPQIMPFFQKKAKYVPSYMCIRSDYWEQTPPMIQGTFDNDFYQWISIQVRQCVNSTKNNNSCKTTEEIHSKLDQGFFEIFFSDAIADYLQPDDPYVPVARTLYDSFSLEYSKEYDMYFRNLKTDSDFGLLTTDIIPFNSLMYSTYQSLISFKSPNPSDWFVNLVIRLETKLDCSQSYKILDTKRSYSKIQDIMGVIGGFWKVITIIGVILVSPVNKLDMQLTVINSLFNFEVVSKKKRSSRLNANENDAHIGMSPSVQINSRSSPGRMINKKESLHDQEPINTNVFNFLREYLEKRGSVIEGNRRGTTTEVKDFLKLKIGKIKLQTVEYLSFFLSCFQNLKAQRNQIRFAIEKYEKDIDLIQILRRLTELEKLKMLLLTQDQLQLFDYLPRPCIPLEQEGQLIQQRYEELLLDTMDKRMKFWQTLQKRKTHKQRALEAFEAYDKLQRSKQLSKLDQKLILFLDPNIRELFKLLHRQDVQDQDRERTEQIEVKLLSVQNEEIQLEDEIKEQDQECYSDRSIQKLDQLATIKNFLN